ncbi:kinase-like protein, partial [Rhizodiscina lignyota]
KSQLANSYGQLLDEFSSKELRTVGNYTLGRLIGKGSFGKVYLASHKLTNGSKVVLKSARKDDANLAREIHHHRQFLHPHIARLYEVIVTESLVWLALEYCPGKFPTTEIGDELYNYLLKTGPIEVPKVQRIFTQLVGAVSYVHNKSCVHRDLKLENILLDKHENVKLVDFGFTREYEGKSSYLQTWCGTVCYSAPEMLKGEKYAGEKVDVWSLGIILYALLCGELPFDDDDEDVTKQKILKEEPKWPEHMPPQAKELITRLISKRPLLRPSLSDVLTNPWLAEHAPQQQAILKLQQPAPFTTELEKETLQRMRSAGVDIDMVIENVLAQRCDSLAGWWALLIEKEERKAKRREKKRKEREAEAKSLRRLSAASSRLERIAPTIRETDEEGQPLLLLGEPPKGRGRNLKRNSSAAAPPDLPQLLETVGEPTHPPLKEPPAPRSASSSRSRPPVPPKESRPARSSMLQVVQSTPDLLTPDTQVQTKRRPRYQQPFFNQLSSLKAWLKQSAMRARSPNTKRSNSVSPQPPRPTTSSRDNHIRRISSGPAHPRSSGQYSSRPQLATRSTFPARPRISTTSSTGSVSGTGAGKRLPSLSPSPLTPHSSYYRRGSAGLRGRKSTSSSVSSVRSIHHVHSHSKASSTSSASLASPSASSSGKPFTGRSPHSSVKVLPATPTSSAFPSNIRVARAPPAPLLLGGGNKDSLTAEGTAAFSSLPPPSPGLIFAKRKRTPFKGPMLHVGGHHGSSPSHSRGRDSGSRSGSIQGRRSGDIIEEADEEDELGEIEGLEGLESEVMLEGDEDEVEEVEEFSPVGPNTEVEVVDDDDVDDSPVKEREDDTAEVVKGDTPVVDANGSPGKGKAKAEDGTVVVHPPS